MLAINPKMVTRSREARMYALIMVMMLAQICFFMRASRLEGLGNYLGVGIKHQFHPPCEQKFTNSARNYGQGLRRRPRQSSDGAT